MNSQKQDVVIGICEMKPDDFTIEQLSDDKYDETITPYLVRAVKEAIVNNEYQELAIMVISQEFEDGQKKVTFVCYQYPNDEFDMRIDNGMIAHFEENIEAPIIKSRIIEIKHSGEAGSGYAPLWAATAELCRFKGYPHWPNLSYKREI